MMRLRHARIPVLTAWVVIGIVVFYFGSHPRLMAPSLSRLVGRHLLRLEKGGIRVRDFHVRAFEGVDLYGVSVTLPGKGRGLVLVSADTVEVDFDLKEALGAVPRLRRVTVRRPEIFARAATDSSNAATSGGPMQITLPKVVIEQLEITDAFLEFSNARGRLIQRVPRLNWRGRVEAGPVTRAVIHHSDVDWETNATRLENLRGELEIDAQRVTVRELSGNLNGNPVEVDGSRSWDGRLHLAVTAEDVSTAEIENLIDMRLGFKARGGVVATLNTVGDTLIYEGVFSGELEGYQMSEVSCRALIGKRDVWLEGIDGWVNDASITGTGHFDISNPNAVSYVLDGDVAEVNLANGLIPGEEDLPPTDGTGRLRIEHTDRPMWTRVSGVMHSGRIDMVPFDTCMVDVEATPTAVTFNRVEIRHGDLHAVVDGVSDSLRVFTGSLSLNIDDLRSVPGEWNWPTVRGRANGQAALQGPLEAMSLRGWVTGYDLATGPMQAAYADVTLTIDDILGTPLVTGTADGGGMLLGAVPFGDFRVNGSVSAAAARLDTFSFSYGDTVGLVRLEAAFSDGIDRVRIDEFRVDLEGTRWALERPLQLGIGKDYFSADDLALASDQGAVTGGGVYDRRRRVSGDLQMRGFDLGLLNPFFETIDPLRGRLTADIEIAGDPEAPTINLIADLVAAPFALARVDSLHVAAGFKQGVLDIQGLDMFTEYGRVRAAGKVSHPGTGIGDYWPGAALDVQLEIPDGDWSFLDQFALPALDRLSGRFNGRVHLGGTTRLPLVEGELRSAPFNVHWLHLDELTGQVWADHNQLVLGNLAGRQDAMQLTGRLELPLLLDLMSEPVSPVDGPFLLEIDIPAGTDLSALAPATNAFATASGTGEAHVRVSGPLEHPLYEGTAHIRDANFVIRHLEEVYSEASLDATFNGDVVHLTNIRGREGLSGSLAGSGILKFKGLELETFDVALDLDRFLVASIPDLRALASGRGVRLNGVKVGPDSLLVPRFSGTLEIIKVRYTGNFAETPGAVDPRLATVAPDWLADLRLHAAPRVAHIVNREMEMDLGGDLDLIRTNEGLHMRGSLDVNRGNLIVFNNTFEVQRGRLDFSRELGFDPRLDIDAETRYRLRGEGSGNTRIEVLGVHVGGTLAAPSVDFSSERGYSREAIQRMLLGLDPEGQPGGDTSRLAATSISAGLNLIEREIAQELQVFDTFEIDQIQRERDAAIGAVGLDPLIGVGKYIGSDLYLKYAQGVRQDDRDLLLEYQINQHMLLQSEMRRRIDENQGESTYNLDLKYRFEY